MKKTVDGAWGTKRAMRRIFGTGGRARAVAGGAVVFFLGLGAACGNEPAKHPWGEGGTLVENFLHYNSDDMHPARVCQSFEAMDTEVLATRGLRPAAIFDLDNTVWSGQAIDPFLAALIELDLVPPRSNPMLRGVLRGVEGVDAAALESNSASENARLLLEHSRDSDLPEAARVDRKNQFYAVAAMMAGLRPEQASRAARHFLLEGTSFYPPWTGQIFASEDGCGMTEIMAVLREQGLDIYLVSAGLEPIVEAAGEFLGVPASHRRGSPLEVSEGVYTGEVESLYSSKQSVVRGLLGGPALLGFGDSAASDFEFMADVAGPVFMVNPNAEFLAKENEHAEGRFVALRYSDTQQSLGSRGTPAQAVSEQGGEGQEPGAPGS